MNTTILVRSMALLLGMHSLFGYAQNDEESSENDHGDDSILSARGHKEPLVDSISDTASLISR